MSKFFATMPDGSRIIVRTTFTAGPFTVPQAELERLSHIRGGYGSEDVLDERDGELSSYHRIRDFERDGTRWTLLQHPTEYALELELTRVRMGRFRCLSPLEAWDLALELDRQETRYPIAREDDSWELTLARQGRPPMVEEVREWPPVPAAD